MRLQVETLAENVGPWHQVVVQYVLVPGLQSGRDNDVWIKALFKPEMPAQISSLGLSTSGEDRRGAVFGIDLQKVRLRINAYGRSERKQLVQDGGDQIGVSTTKISVDLNICEISIGRPADECVGSCQTPEAS